MTSTLILTALREYIAETIDDVEISIDGDAEQLDPTYIELTCSGTREHEILRGVLELGISARIISVPQDVVVTELEETLYNIVGNNEELVFWCDANIENCRIFQVRDFDMNTEGDSDNRVSNITFLCTGCKL